MVQICDIDGCVKLIEGRGRGWPKIESRSFHASTMSTMVLKYDPNLRRYKEVEP